MAGNKIGGIKASLKNKEKYGEDFYKNIGQKGGSVLGVTKGFAIAKSYPEDDPRHPSNAGRKGGTVSKRRKAIKQDA